MVSSSTIRSSSARARSSRGEKTDGPAGSKLMLDIQALRGCRVLDVASFLAGPFAATQLAEFGAEVIKVELPGVGDATRRFGTMTECGDTLPWLSESRNKKCITLDLRKPDGVALLKRLVAD